MPHHIVVADDDSALRQFLAMSLERAGYRVTVFDNGLSAFDFFQGGETADLLLADIVMPGLDGIELAQKATTAQPGLKVMYLTGFATVAQNRLQNGPADTQVLAKPVHLGLLIDQVEKALKAAA